MKKDFLYLTLAMILLYLVSLLTYSVYTYYVSQTKINEIGFKEFDIRK